MTKRFRRAAALLITLCVLLSLLPAALAAEGELTRAELAVLVYGKFQPEPPEEDPGFTDIGTCTEEQREAINALAGAGILDGRADGTFDPGGSVTRVQAALILWRALGQPAAGSDPLCRRAGPRRNCRERPLRTGDFDGGGRRGGQISA